MPERIKPVPPVSLLSSEIYKQAALALYMRFIFVDGEGRKFTAESAHFMHDLRPVVDVPPPPTGPVPPPVGPTGTDGSP